MKKNKPLKPEIEMSKVNLSTLIEFYVSDMQRRNCTPDSVKTNRCGLVRFMHFIATGEEALSLLDVTQDKVNRYVTDLQTRTRKWVGHPYHPTIEAKLSPFTVRKEVKILRGFGTWLASEGFVNPFEDLDIPKVPKYLVEVLTDEEIGKLFNDLNPNTVFGARLMAMLLLLLDSGLRISELAGAQLSQLDLQRRQLRVVGKGMKERVVPFGARTAQSILRYTNLFRPEPRRAEFTNVFLSLDGQPLTRNSLEAMLGRLRMASGIARLHGHLFRHTFAVKYLLNGGDLITLQSILGHESLEVTKRYLHFTVAQKQARYEAFSPVDRLALQGFRRFGNRRKPESQKNIAAGQSKSVDEGLELSSDKSMGADRQLNTGRRRSSQG